MLAVFHREHLLEVSKTEDSEYPWKASLYGSDDIFVCNFEMSAAYNFPNPALVLKEAKKIADQVIDNKIDWQDEP